jgi:site-specific DNA recombinase
MPDKPPVRTCAIYTRKSSDEGLEQEFNSLDAQREAGEAFVRSQAHEGWRLSDKHYDDGGISGGTLQRPGLQDLLADIRANKVQIVVVYKVDRLSRSLSDFAKLIDVFEKHGVSFVSVTQQFNTTNSMGRLMLNVLLSFAQFEREVTGERIRDKILASRKKGMWMGGTPPLGYEVKDRKLVINPTEAELVRLIYNRYIELGSVTDLKEELDRQGHRTKAYVSATGRKTGNQRFSRGHIYHILKNRVFIGEAVHKGVSYPGEHDPIIDPDVWERVQASLAEKRNGERSALSNSETVLLKGLLFDDAGNRMTPTFGKKGMRRYRYYVSQAVIQGRPGDAGSIPRLPAGDFDEWFLSEFIRGASDSDEHRHLARMLRKASDDERRAMLKSVVRKVTVRAAEVEVSCAAAGEGAPELRTGLRLPHHYRKLPKGVRIAASGQSTSVSSTLVKALVRAHEWGDRLLDGEVTSIRELARSARVTPAYVRRVIRLRFLAPDIISEIIDGRQEVSLTTEITRAPIPLCWAQQRNHLTPIT